jgi:hypothetical protein
MTIPACFTSPQYAALRERLRPLRERRFGDLERVRALRLRFAVPEERRLSAIEILVLLVLEHAASRPQRPRGPAIAPAYGPATPLVRVPGASAAPRPGSRASQIQTEMLRLSHQRRESSHRPCFVPGTWQGAWRRRRRPPRCAARA